MRSPRLRDLGLVGALGLLLCAIPRNAPAQEVRAVPGPAGLQATAVSSSQIDLTWTRVNTGLVVQYRIYRYPSNALITTVPASQSSYTDSGLSPWTEYSYYVTGATNSGNESGASNVATARTLDGTPPTAPGNLNGTASGSREITLTWTAASDPQSGVSGYIVYRNDTEVGQTTQLSYIDGSLERDTQYSYKVSAVNGQGDEGAPAGPFQVRTPPPSPPGSPSDLSADALSPTEVTLDWRPPLDDDDVDGYRVYRNGSPVATTSGSDYRDTGLAPFTVYEYRVTAFDDDDESTPSNAASVRTLDATPPTAPGNFAGSAVSQTRISLSWAAATDPQTGVAEYVVYRGGSEIGRTASLTYQDDGLTVDTQYSYGVSAINGQGDEGSRAGPIQVRTLADPTPDPPRNLTATAFSSTAIDLSWLPPADASKVASYRIYRDGSAVGTTGATSFRDSGLQSYVSYEYRITAVGAGGEESGPSNAASARTLDGTPPTSPGSLVGTALSQTQVSLSWSAASDPESGISQYIVYRDGGEIARTAALSYDDGGLEADQVYAYQVSAVNGQGDQGNRAGPVEVRTLSDVAPDPPTGLAAQAVDENTVDLTWDPHPDDDIDGYRVYRDGLFVADTGATSYRDAGLAAFTTYVYTVTVVAEDGDESAPSTSATVATPDVTGPAVPQALSATAVGTQRVDLAWSPSSDGESGILGYRIFRDGGEIAVTEATVFQDSELAPGTTYEYRVSAINGAELESGLSDPASATTLDGSGPSVPTGLGATPVSTESISVAWSPSTDSESGIAYYRLFRDGSEIASPAGTEFLDTGLTSGTEYEYRVSAVNGDGLESDLSAAVSATTLTDEGPPPPTGLTATPLDASQIRLAWTAPDGGAAGYNVFRDQVFIGTVMATAFVDTGLQPSSTYLYSVASVDADGIQGPLSGQISATTAPTADVVPPAAPTGLRLITP